MCAKIRNNCFNDFTPLINSVTSSASPRLLVRSGSARDSCRTLGKKITLNDFLLHSYSDYVACIIKFTNPELHKKIFKAGCCGGDVGEGGGDSGGRRRFLYKHRIRCPTFEINLFCSTCGLQFKDVRNYHL